jgi:hypothetical protein
MHPRGNGTRALAVGVAVLVALAVTLPAPGALADVAFRKKKAPVSSDEAAPSGGEATGEIGNAPAEGEATPAPKTQYVPQADDKDRPRDPSLLDKPPEGTVTAKPAKKDEGPAWYSKWQNWALIGGIAAGVALVVVGGSFVVHSASGGDVRACNMKAFFTCEGQGR